MQKTANISEAERRDVLAATQNKTDYNSISDALRNLCENTDGANPPRKWAGSRETDPWVQDDWGVWHQAEAAWYCTQDGWMHDVNAATWSYDPHSSFDPWDENNWYDAHAAFTADWGIATRSVLAFGIDKALCPLDKLPDHPPACRSERINNGLFRGISRPAFGHA